MRIAIGIVALVLAACATGAPGSARRSCYDAGLQPGTSAFEDCWKRIRDQQMAGTLSDVAAVGLITAAAAAQSAPRAPAPPSPRTIMCPDGTYVYGVRCQIAPDGTYVGVPQ